MVQLNANDHSGDRAGLPRPYSSQNQNLISNSFKTEYTVCPKCFLNKGSVIGCHQSFLPVNYFKDAHCAHKVTIKQLTL